MPERAWRIAVLSAVLDGTIYDTLRHGFHDERTDGGEYIPLRDRRPSVRYNLSRIVVDDTVALLFGEGRFPAITAPDKAASESMADLVAECCINHTMRAAAFTGSVGSSAVLFRILRERPFVNVLDTRFLTPVWDPEAPDVLIRVIERYKVRGRDLQARGYAIDHDDLGADHWFMRAWDAEAETWFLPQPVHRDEAMQPDPQRSVTHALGFVPVVWMRNLPSGDDTDGACTFRPAIETQIEIEYQLSQAGRGLKYSSDPLLMLREPAAPTGGPMLRSASNAVLVSEKGDAKLLEINGTAAGAVVEYVRALREMALESCHGNRSNADKVSAAQSGRALELLHQPLLQVTDMLRISYGTEGLLPLMRMIAAASHRVPLRLRNTTLRRLDADSLGLRWPAWFSPTAGDKQVQATTLTVLRDAGHISRETAVNVVAHNYDIEDVPAELARIEADEAEAAERAVSVGAQVKGALKVEE